MACISASVTDIQENNKDLFTFAYNLRKQDTNNNYTRLFLEGNVKSKILIEIICANIWKDSDKYKNNSMMTVDPDVFFKVQLGDAILQFPTT